ncbi:hypothetical protein EJB05_47657, partial [Eragrostis curvula]
MEAAEELEAGMDGLSNRKPWRRACRRQQCTGGARCKATVGDPAGKCTETDGRRPSLPYSVQLKLAAFSPDGSVRTTLFKFGDLQASASPCADITIDAARGLWARVFSPADKDAAPPLPVVVYFHGGGFVLFSAASRLYDALCRRLCHELGVVVVSINYRLAPHHRFPVAYDDGVAALRYLDAHGLPAEVAPVAVDFSSCFLAGDSAGGNIAHHVAQRWSSPTSPHGRGNNNNLRLAGAVLIQPLFGGEERTAAEMELANVCPSLTLAGFDPLKDRHASYVEMLLLDKGNDKAVRLAEYPDAIHDFYLFPEIADSGKLMTDIKLFLEEHKSN